MANTEVHNALVDYQNGRPIGVTQQLEDIRRQAQNTLIDTSLPVGGAPPMAAQLRPSESYAEQAAAQGWGTERFDRGLFNPDIDLEDRRAREQSGFSKIANGSAKGLVTTGTTFVANTAGIIDGLLEGIGAIGGGNGSGDVVDAAVNNYTAQLMNKIRALSDEWFPNYKTEEERTPEYQRSWLRHVASANSVGEFINNLGFTAGSVLSGGLWSRGIGAVASRVAAGNLMKGVAVAASGEEASAAAQASLKQAIARYAKGVATTADVQAITRNIKGAANTLNLTKGITMVAGATLGAIGEGTMEGQMARDEYMQDRTAQINSDYMQAQEAIYQELINDPRYRRVGFPGKEDGDMRPQFELNERGRVEAIRRQQALGQKLRQVQDETEQSADRLATMTFAFNIPVLTLSNLIEFGRMFSGGYKTARMTKAAVRGALGAGYEAAEDILPNVVKTSLKTAASESAEEMIQGVVSSGNKRVASLGLTSFNDDGYNKETQVRFVDRIAAFAEGAGEYLGDWANWQEGFMGMVTGLLGMPGMSRITGVKGWSGGILGAVREAREARETSQDLAERLNKTTSTKDFLERWKGSVRHDYYTAELQDALDHEDEYAWHTADEKLLANDIKLFADAGRLEELEQFATRFSENLSEEDIADIREGMMIPGNEKSEKQITQLTDAQITERVQKQAAKTLDMIHEYRDLMDALTTILPTDVSDEQLAEAIFTSQQIKSFERRFLTLYAEVMEGTKEHKGLKELISADALKSRDNKPLSSPEEILARETEILSNITAFFTDSLLPQKMTPELQKVIDKQMAMLHKRAEGDPLLTKKIDDLKKLSDDRKDFFKKLSTLELIKPEEFTKQMQTPESTKEELKAEQADAQLQKATSPRDIVEGFIKAKNKPVFLDEMRKRQDKDPNAAEFLKMHKIATDFMRYVNNDQETQFLSGETTASILRKLASSLLRRATSSDDILDIDKTAISFDEIKALLSESATTPPISDAALQGSYDEALQILKEKAAQYKKDVLDHSAEKAPGTPAAAKPEATEQYKGEKAPVADEKVGSTDGPISAPPATPAPEEKSPEAAAETPEAAIEKADAQAVTIPEHPGVSENTEGESLADETIDAYDDPVSDEDVEVQPATKEGLDETGTPVDVYHYYRTSVPEIPSWAAKEARKIIFEVTEGIITREQAREQLAAIAEDLRDLPEVEPAFKEIYDALVSKQAFDNIRNLKKGDEVFFIVDPTFFQFGETPTILMATKNSDGTYNVLNALAEGKSPVSQYLNLAQLREQILKEYNEFHEAHPAETFTFSKTSHVWAVRDGIITYDYSDAESRTGSAEKTLKDAGDDGSSPIVFVHNSGIVDLRRKQTLNLGNLLRGVGSRGKLYYLARNGSGLTPVRLNVPHFNTASVDKFGTTKRFQDIAAVLKTLSDKVAAANSLFEKNELTPEALEQARSEVRKVISSLNKLVDLHRDIISLGVTKDNLLTLKVVKNYHGNSMSGDELNDRGDEERIEYVASSVNTALLAEILASLDRPIQVSAETSPSDLNQMVADGIITTNAESLKPRGMDFYIHPWFPAQEGREAGFYRSDAEAEATAIEDIAEEASVPETQPIVNDAQAITVDINFADEDLPEEAAAPAEFPEEEDDGVVGVRIDEQALKDKGMTEQDIARMKQEIAKKMIDCG